MKKETLRDKLNRVLECDLSDYQVELIENHLSHILFWNTKINLTSITDVAAAEVLHIEDSLTGLRFVNKAIEGKLVDIGSGGGFPGIPLSIASCRETSLVEARTKKIQVLNEFIKNSSLEKQINTISKRAEELAVESNNSFSVVTARALSTLPVVMELASPLLTKSGTLIAYKGNLPKDETDSAKKLQETLGLSITEVKPITLSDGVSSRTLVVFEKTGDPLISLPRRVGMAQKKPLL